MFISLFLLLPLVCFGDIPRPVKPNIVIYVMDDVGWSDVSVHNATNDIQTPFLDSLSKDGITLDQYYTQPVCSPSRACLMQGRYAWKTGMQHYETIMPASVAKLNSEPTLAEVLRAANYSTQMVGKWHLGYDSWKATPTGRGFEV